MYIVMILLIAIADIVSKSNLINGDWDKRNKFVCWVSAIVMFLFYSLHNETVGIDTPTYFKLFSQDVNLSINDIMNASSGMEQSRDKFFHVFMHLLGYITDNPVIMLAIIGLMISISMIVLVYRYSYDPALTILMFITLREFGFTVSGLRQSLAMAFIFLAMQFIFQRKPIKAIIITIIAGLFHGSALVFLIAYPLSLCKKNRRIAFCIVLFGAICVVSNYLPLRLIAFLPYIGTRFSSKLAFGDSTSSGVTMFVIYLIMLIFSMIVVRRDETDWVDSIDEDNQLFRRIEINYGLVSLFFIFLSFQSANIFRLSSYFSMGIFLIFPDVLSNALTEKSYRFARFAVIALLIIQYIALGTSAGIENYGFIWE